MLLGRLELRDAVVVGKMLDEYPQLCTLVDPVVYGNVILERPSCLDHIHPTLITPINTVTPEMVPSILKCPQLLDNVTVDSAVFLDMLPSLPDRLVHLSSLVPPDSHLATVIHTHHLTPLFFTRPNLCHPKLPVVLSKHKDVMLLLVVSLLVLLLLLRVM